MEKKNIGIDCDEVLCLFMKDFVPYMNEHFNLQLNYEDLKEYDLNKYFHLKEEKYWEQFVEYCKERPKYLEVIEGSREALKLLSTKYNLILITGRHENLWKEATEYWINKNLEGVPIEKLIYASDRYCDNVIAKDRPVKSLICEEENISIFIDDRERYIIECIPVCEKLILFGNYPWTFYGIEDPKVTYCGNWESVLKQLM